MSPETFFTIGAIVFAAGIIYNKVDALDKRVTNLEVRLFPANINSNREDRK